MNPNERDAYENRLAREREDWEAENRARERVRDAAEDLLKLCKAFLASEFVGGTIGATYYHIKDSVRDEARALIERLEPREAEGG